MELLIKDEQGALAIDFSVVESIVKNDEFLKEIERIFCRNKKRKRAIKAFDYEFDGKSLSIDCCVGGTLYKIYYWTESNLYSIESFGSVDAMSLLVKSGYTISKENIPFNF